MLVLITKLITNNVGLTLLQDFFAKLLFVNELLVLLFIHSL